MIAAVDIGNTNATIGLMKEAAVAGVVKMDTALLGSRRRFLAALTEKLSAGRPGARDVEAVYVSSVVPEIDETACRVLAEVFRKQPLVIGRDIHVPLINRYRIPSQVGQDRLVNAYAGLKLYGRGLIIVDFGTAITFDIISRKSEYLGGIIVPGLKLMREALHKKTALLPYVELARPIEIIGRDTVSSIRAGIVYGAAALCDGIIDRLRKKECPRYKVIATGGDAHLIRPYVSSFDHIEDLLVLKGLYLIFRSQQHPRK